MKQLIVVLLMFFLTFTSYGQTSISSKLALMLGASLASPYA